MHEQQLRETVFAALPAGLGKEARSLIEGLSTLEENVWTLTRAINSHLDSESSRTMTLLANWVEAATTLARRNETLLKRGEALVAGCLHADLSAELVASVRDRVAPFLEDIATAQQHFREAARRAAEQEFQG